MKNEKQSAFKLSCLQLSGALSLPVILVGYFIGQHFTFYQAIMQLVIGNVILFILSRCYMSLVTRYSYSTIEFANHLFGSQGKLICALGMSLSLVGWSAIQLNLIYSLTGHSLVVGGVLGALIFLFSFRELGFLAKLNQLLLPLICVSLACLMVSLSEKRLVSAVFENPLNFQIGVVLILSAASGMVFDLPTFFRHAKTSRDGAMSLAFLFLIALPLIEGLGIYLAHLEPLLGSELKGVQGFLASFNKTTLLFLIGSGLLGACLNLYSTSIIINRTMGLAYKKALGLGCLSAFLLSLFDIQHYFSGFLEVISLCAEVLALITLSYALLNRFKLPKPTERQKQIHQLIFYSILAFAVISRISDISLFQDVFLDAGFLSCSLIFLYHIPKRIREKIL